MIVDVAGHKQETMSDLFVSITIHYPEETSTDRFHVTSKLQNLNFKTYKAGRFAHFTDRCCEFVLKILG